MEMKTVKLGDIAEFANGLNFDKAAYRAGVKIIGVSDFKDYSTPVIDSLTEVAIDAVKESARLKENDIIFVRSNGNKDLVGRCMIIPQASEKLYFSGFCIRCRFKNTVYANPRYFLYLFKSPSFRRQLSNTSVGANIQNLSQSRLAIASVPLPTREVQDRIASILSAYDDMIDNCKKQIALLEEAAQRLYREWFVDLRFPGHETTPIGENGLPKGWKIGTIDDVVKFFDAQRKPLSSMQRAKMEKIYPYHGATSVMDYVDNYIFDGLYVLMGEDGSVIDNNGYPFLQLVCGKFWVNNHAHVIQGGENFPTEYIYSMLLHMPVNDVVTGSAQLKISQERLKRKTIVIPSDEVIILYARMVKPIFQQLLCKKEILNRVKASLGILLPRLISGQIEINA